MLEGINLIGNVVRATYGPNGKNIAHSKMNPIISNDGSVVIDELKFSNPFINTGARILYEVGNKTFDDVADGTTLSMILCQDMINLGIKAIEEGVNPILLKEGMDIACKEIVNEINKLSRKVETTIDLINVAGCASKNKKIGKIVGELVDKVGKDGLVIVEEGKGIDTKITLSSGYEYDRGFVSNHLLIDKTKKEITYLNPLILITDHKITNPFQLVKVFEYVMEENKPLLVIAGSYDDEVINMVSINNIKHILKVILIKAPGFGDNQKELLEDIAILTNGKFYSKDLNMKLEDIDINDLGNVSKIVVTNNSTTLITENINNIILERRKREIREQLKDASYFLRKRLEERLARLSGKIAVIEVGGKTEFEIQENVKLYKRSVSACKSSLEEGIISGGGKVFNQIYNNLKKKLRNEEYGIQRGIDIVLEASLSPLRQILKNGKDNQDLFDLMDEEGVIDSAKIIKTALLNSTNISGLFITTEAAIVTNDNILKQSPLFSHLYK